MHRFLGPSLKESQQADKAHGILRSGETRHPGTLVHLASYAQYGDSLDGHGLPGSLVGRMISLF